MKKTIFISFFCFFVLSAGSVYAGTSQIQLVTYYPSPTAAYNQVKLPSQSSPTYCSAPILQPNGTIFLDTSTSPQGSLKVCYNGAAQVYPQQCYNSFCPYPSVGGVCTHPPAAPCNPPCSNGFASLGFKDLMQTDSNNCVASIVCCGGS